MAPQTSTIPARPVEVACSQSSPGTWIEPSLLAANAAWHAPEVTPWNPPYWESPVNAIVDQAETPAYWEPPVNATVGQAGQAEPLTSWLWASGLPSCKNDLAEQLRAVEPEAYEE